MNKLLMLFFFIAAVFLSEVTEAQTLIAASPEEAGISKARLENVDRLITTYIDESKIPGGVFLIARKGKIAYHKSFGLKNNENETPYRNDDIFRIASMTKAVTSVAVMQLIERGLLGLDEPVSRYIPAFKNQKVLDIFNEKDSTFTTVDAVRPVTIRHLLTHTSGIVYGAFNPGKLQAVYEKYNMNNVGLSHPEWTTEEFINRLAEVPLAFQPGDKYTYGLNMDVLGRVIEVISGQNLAEYFRDNIFKPLDMNDTWFYLPEELNSRLAPVYFQDDEGYRLSDNEGGLGALDYPLQKGLNHFAGGGGLSSTALDYARFIATLENNGNYNGYQLLGRKTIELMTTDQMILLNRKGSGFSDIPGVTFCLGFGLLTEEGNGINIKSPGTYEWGGYFNTKYFIDPKEDLIFVGMTQIVPFRHSDFWDKLYAAIYGAVE